MDPSIDVMHISKRYRVGTGVLSLRDVLAVNRNRREEKHHWALKDVSFELRPGDALGIIGPNGAGKTTILKILSRVTEPTSGEIFVNGRFSALIELGAGFHPDLTGRENIYLNGTILGMRRTEIKSRFDQIVDFSGIEKYLDTPVKRYSSGMYARLGFSIAAHADPDVLLVDEVLAVGDMGFRAKCYDRMLHLLKKGITLIFVSHDFGAIQRVCNRCIVLNLGAVVFEGRSSEAVAQYSNILRSSATQVNQKNGDKFEGLSLGVMTKEAEIEDVQLFNGDGKSAVSFVTGETMRVLVRVKFKKNVASPAFACTIRQSDGRIIYNYFTHWAGLSTPYFSAGSSTEVEFPLELHLLNGTYQLGVNIAYSDLSNYYDRIDRALDFVVTSTDGAQGIANLQAAFKVIGTHESGGSPL